MIEEIGFLIKDRSSIKNISNNFFNNYINPAEIDPSYGRVEGNTVIYLGARVDPSDLEEYSCMSVYKGKKIYYKLNSHAHRCEEFKPLDDNKTNILFAGCSATFGEALPEGYTWDNHLYRTLSSTYPNIGPFNSLGYPGQGADHIVDNIITYCNTFGNPKTIYVLLPDYGRMKSWDSKSQSFRTIFPDNKTKHSANQTDLHDFLLEYVRSIQRLSDYCTINNISLFMTSWDAPTSYLISKLNLKNFISIYDSDGNPQLLHRLDYELEVTPYTDLEFLFDAADEQHYGLVGQLSFAKNIYEISKELGMI
jgi:hypothetical protein